MRALLLAAGLGERLRPLTLTKPKALMPIANRPSIIRLLESVQSLELDEIFINLHFLKDDIKDEISAGTRWNCPIQYSYETELLGTAGAIRKIGKFLADDRFVIINTDIVTDIDLPSVIEGHIKTGAKATLVLSKQDDIDYEQIGVSSDGRILIDKKSGDLITNGVYTGIGIFEPSVIEMIPTGYSSLLEAVLIPLADEGTLYAHFAEGYWMDIGKVDRYIQAGRDVISGKTRLPIDGRLIGDNLWINEFSEIDMTVRIEEPVLIGEGVAVDRGTRIGPNVIIGDGCQIGAGVEISNSVIWNDCRIGGSSIIEHSVISNNEKIAPKQKVKRVIVHRGVAEPIFNI
ncbi:MAG: NDP-sugar synthase [Actinobacteria bacterium]|nr:NDP-sugar synthase [Actinomycetota bacterium]